MEKTDRKFLMENLLGETWTAYESGCDCAECQSWIGNRAFTTHQDIVDCVEALRKQGKWDDFCDIVHLSLSGFVARQFADILTTPELFHSKVVEYLKQRYTLEAEIVKLSR